MIFLKTEQNKLSELIENNEIAFLQTDTLFCLTCNALSHDSVEKIYKIKQRSQNKTLPIFIDSVSMLENYAKTNNLVYILSERFWPGAITMILNCKEKIRISPLTIKNNKIAVRIPDSKIILDIINDIQKPIIATSANISDQKNTISINEFIEQTKLNSYEEYTIYYIDQCEKKTYSHSTIVDLTKNNVIKIVRDGAISRKQIQLLFQNQNVHIE